MSKGQKVEVQRAENATFVANCTSTETTEGNENGSRCTKQEWAGRSVAETGKRLFG